MHGPALAGPQWRAWSTGGSASHGRTALKNRLAGHGTARRGTHGSTDWDTGLHWRRGRPRWGLVYRTRPGLRNNHSRSRWRRSGRARHYRWRRTYGCSCRLLNLDRKRRRDWPRGRRRNRRRRRRCYRRSHNRARRNHGCCRRRCHGWRRRSRRLRNQRRHRRGTTHGCRRCWHRLLGRGRSDRRGPWWGWSCCRLFALRNRLQHIARTGDV